MTKDISVATGINDYKIDFDFSEYGTLIDAFVTQHPLDNRNTVCYGINLGLDKSSSSGIVIVYIATNRQTANTVRIRCSALIHPK